MAIKHYSFTLAFPHGSKLDYQFNDREVRNLIHELVRDLPSKSTVYYWPRMKKDKGVVQDLYLVNRKIDKRIISSFKEDEICGRFNRIMMGEVISTDSVSYYTGKITLEGNSKVYVNEESINGLWLYPVLGCDSQKRRYWIDKLVVSQKDPMYNSIKPPVKNGATCG